MDAPKKWRFRFGLRTLLGVVALVGAGIYLRPGQITPSDIPVGKTKSWVRWYCGSPTIEADSAIWLFSAEPDFAVQVLFDEAGFVGQVDLLSFDTEYIPAHHIVP